VYSHSCITRSRAACAAGAAVGSGDRLVDELILRPWPGSVRSPSVSTTVVSGCLYWPVQADREEVKRKPSPGTTGTRLVTWDGILR
jgi:hypothetical protein